MRIKGLLKNKTALLVVMALVMVLGVSVKESLAYFTTFATAKGGYDVALGWETEIDEEFVDNKKTISIENTGDMDCYVRVKVLATQEANLKFSGSDKWKQGGDGYWYYSDIVKANSKTESLIATIGPVDKDVIKADFDVVVIHESAPVLYDDEGKALPSDSAEVWSQKIERKGA